jgi:hypothetical protein
MTTPDCTLTGGNCNSGLDCSPSSSLQSRFSTLRLPSYSPSERCTSRTAFYGRRRAETKRAGRDPTLQQFYATGILRLTQRWKKCADNDGDFVENNLNFVKDVPMIYATFIIIIIRVYEKKGGIWRHYFHTAPRKIPCVYVTGSVRIT